MAGKERWTREWHEEQVTKFDHERAKYRRYARTLGKLLRELRKRHAPTAIVQARAKSLESFAEKIIRKWPKYDDPVHQLTDLCGARVVTYTQVEANRICAAIEEDPGFDIDEANSMDVSSRLRTSEFGYRAVHYVVQLTGEGISSGVPNETKRLWAEIQVCTMLQHVWAAIGHDRLYKAQVTVQSHMERRTNGVAAILENADNEFAHVIRSLDRYISDFDAYMRPKQMEEEIDKWSAVLAVERRSEKAAHNIAQLRIARGEWEEARDVLTPFRRSRSSAVIRDLGRSDCNTGDVRRGRKRLARALALDERNVAARCDLGDSWPASRAKKALEHYEQAFETAPNEPRVLRSYLECRMQVERQADLLPAMRGGLEAAIQECRDRAELRVYLPEAYYDMGRFQLFLGRPYESLNAYAKAVQLSTRLEPIREALDATTKLANALEGSPMEGLEWVRRFLIVTAAGKALLLARERTADGRLTKSRARKAWQEAKQAVGEDTFDGLRSKEPPEFKRPVVIGAGGCDARVAKRLRRTYGKSLKTAFDEFEGTIISGGTTAGISGMLGNLVPFQEDAVLKTAYLPPSVPEGDHVHAKYEKVTIEDSGYTPLGPIQTWTDLLLAGVRPWEVKLLGINGGKLAAFEYRLGLAIGANVGIVESSGRAASEILPDADWWNVPNLIRLPHDPMTLRAFVNPGAARLAERTLGKAGKAVHADYVHQNECRSKKMDPSMMPWRCLRQDYRESNIQQAAYAAEILRRCGYRVVHAAKGQRIRLLEFTEDEVRKMAEMEHGRWNAERLLSGWRYGPQNDPENRINPYIVPWNELSEQIRTYDYDAVRNFPKVLAKAGLKVRRLGQSTGRGIKTQKKPKRRHRRKTK